LDFYLLLLQINFKLWKLLLNVHIQLISTFQLGYTGSFVNLLGAEGSNNNKNIKKLSLAEINENKHLHEVMAKANQGTRRIEDAFKKMSEEFAVLKKRLDKVVDESPLKPKA
jgi:hypothetical protein